MNGTRHLVLLNRCVAFLVRSASTEHAMSGSGTNVAMVDMSPSLHWRERCQVRLIVLCIYVVVHKVIAALANSAHSKSNATTFCNAPKFNHSVSPSAVIIQAVLPYCGHVRATMALQEVLDTPHRKIAFVFTQWSPRGIRRLAVHTLREKKVWYTFSLGGETGVHFIFLPKRENAFPFNRLDTRFSPRERKKLSPFVS